MKSDQVELRKIFSNNKRWISNRLKEDPQYFKKLAAGQKPEFLYIGCSDSRASAEELMGLKPGEIFVHRNIANLVVSTDGNINAVVQFAVEHLKVKHIIVCGHYECGGVGAAMHPSDLGQLNSWLQNLRDVYRLHWQELNNIQNERKRYDRLVELNVIEQCINIIKIDHFQRAWYKTGFPRLHAWVFNMRTGALKDLHFKPNEVMADIRAIFDLKPLS